MSDDKGSDGRSPAARGYVLASRASSIGLQMVIPAGIGWWVDVRWKTAPWFTIVGVLLGFLVVMIEIVRIAQESQRTSSTSGNRRLETGEQSGRQQGEP